MLRGILIAAAALALLPAAAAAPAAPRVAAFPSAQTIPASGALPQGGAPLVSLNTGIGEREAAWLVVTGAHQVSAQVDGSRLGPIKAAVFFGHFVSVDGRAVPDALLPWDGSTRVTEKPNQPLYLQVDVPADARPGGYQATVTVVADGARTDVPVAITVYDVRLPEPGSGENLLTSFHVVPEAYVNKADQLYQLGSNAVRAQVNARFFSFLAGYRVSPAGWGFGEPRTELGYTTSKKWWLSAADNMVDQEPAAFSALRIPVSNQRPTPANRIAKLSPFDPESWCSYLGRVRSFWDEHGWLAGRLAYLYTLDEPGTEGMKLVGRQASVGHRCWAGARMLVTGNPSATNRFLWDGRGADDVDIWAVLGRRYYGQYSRPTDRLGLIDQARRNGKMIWSYTYTGTPGTPGYSAREPLSNPRMFLLWNALEGLRGTLYAQGITSYRPGNPLDVLPNGGENVLVYPGRSGPVASARLEQIRDGIEDWAVFDRIRRTRGASAVRTILAGAGLFSATPAGVKLACTFQCELKSTTAYSWPQFSKDASTAAKIEAARVRALRAAAVL